MKPCSGHKKRIVLLATRSLPEKEAESVRKHLDQCCACHQYWNEISRLCNEQFALAAHEPIRELDSRFHQRVVSRIKESERVKETPASLVRPFVEVPVLVRSKVVLAGLAILMVAGWVAFLGARKKVEGPSLISTASSDSPRFAGATAPAPTLMAYQLAATRSLEDLDALLAKDADRLAPATALLTASARGVGLDE